MAARSASSETRMDYSNFLRVYPAYQSTLAMDALRAREYARLDEQHHAFEQPQNARDKRLRLEINPVGHPEYARTFFVSPWHIKQLEDVLEMRRHHGRQFQLTVHGPGLLAYALEHSGDVDVAVEDDGPLSGESTAASKE